jgi:hypothetical protein
MKTEYTMSNKEKLYHQVNLVAVPAIILSGILMGIMGNMADLNQISMSDPIISISSSLLWFIFGTSTLWILVSGVVNKNIKAIATKSLNGILKSFIAKVIFVTILVVAVLISPLLVIGFLLLAGYLFTTSVKALKPSISTSL